MAQGLTFRINPDSEVASLDLFHRALGDINRLLLDANYAIRREKSVKSWVVSNLQSSAPTITIGSLLDDQEALEAVGLGIRAVAAGTDHPPTFFTEKELEDLKRMTRLFTGRDRARSITVSINGDEIAEIEQDISTKVDRILTSGYSNLGSLEGVMEAINLHGSPTFTIWERVSRAPVRCSFPNESVWKERVRELLERRVMVRGFVRYFANGFPRRVSAIADLQDATSEQGLSRASFGSITNSEAARDPVAFLNSVRRMERV